MKKKIFVFLFDGFSDWEIAYCTPEINKSELFELVYFSLDGDWVCSMGGMKIQPDMSIAEVAIQDMEMLILPGGVAWEKGGNTDLDILAKDVFQKGIIIAAICAATTYLARLGFLNTLKHTSNDKNYIKGIARGYAGEEFYEEKLAVSDKNIITASGIAPIEFSREIFEKLSLYDRDKIKQWFQLFKRGIWDK